MKNKKLWQKAGSLILSAALAVSCLSGVPATEAAAASDVANWQKEVYIDFGTGTNLEEGTNKDLDMAGAPLLPPQISQEATKALIAGYGSWIYDNTDVGTVYGGTATAQKIGFDRALPAGVTTAGGEYFRDWVFSPDGEAYTFSVDLPVGQYQIYVYTGNKTQGYNNTSLVSFSDNGYQITYDQSSNGGGQYQPPGCIYVVNVTEKTAGCGYGTLGVKVFDNTIVTSDDGYDPDKYTEANTTFYKSNKEEIFAGAGVKEFVANGNSNAVDGKIVTARLNGIEIMPVENPVTAESVVATEEDTNISVEVGQTTTVSAAAAPEGVTERIEYFSSDESIVKVNPKTGEITGVAQGEATVTATTPSLIGNAQKSAAYTVKVFEETSLELDKASVSLKINGDEGEDKATVTATFDAADLTEANTAIVQSISSECANITFGSVTEKTAPSEGTKGTYTQDITLTAKAKGNETIAIRRTTGRTATLSLSVTTLPTSVEFVDEAGAKVENFTMSAGTTLTVKAKALPEEASQSVSYKFKENTDIATINSNSGKITAKKSGTVTIQAVSRSKDSVIGEAALNITPGYGISYKTAEIAMKVGESKTNELTITYVENVDQTLLDKTVTYASSAPSIAEVNKDTGAVTAKSAGEATITATAADGGQTATFKVKVAAAEKPATHATALNVDKKTITLNINSKKTKTAQIKATLTPAGSTDTISYTSNKPAIVKVDQKGVVTALKTGTAKITVKSSNGLTQVVTVKVTSPATKVKLTGKKTIKFKKGKKNTLKLKATVTPKNSTDKVKWSTSNKKVATVSQKGVVTAKKKGKVKITAKAGKKKATVKITIK